METTIFQLLLGYFLAINVLAFSAYGVDKRKARRGAWRIPEATLLILDSSRAFQENDFEGIGGAERWFTNF